MKSLLFSFIAFLLLFLQVNAQQRTIAGTVISGTGSVPVIGATVQVKSTFSGTVTDKNGEYKIKASQGDTLEFRFIGMKNKTAVVNTSDVIDVILEFEVVVIDEVVIVGYGSQMKSKITGSISKIDGESVKNLPVQSIDQALQENQPGYSLKLKAGKHQARSDCGSGVQHLFLPGMIR